MKQGIIQNHGMYLYISYLLASSEHSQNDPVTLHIAINIYLERK